MSLWSALESEQSMMNCHKLLKAYFTNVHKVKDPAGNASVYMRSMKILKEFIDKTYGGVTAFFGNEIQSDKGIEEEKNSEKMWGNTKTVNINVPRPSREELQKYLKVWDALENYSLQENALEKLFHRTYRYNNNIDDVLIKVSALNDFYSTNIFSPFQVAKHIVGLDIDDRLKEGDVTLVNDIARVHMIMVRLRISILLPQSIAVIIIHWSFLYMIVTWIKSFVILER